MLGGNGVQDTTVRGVNHTTRDFRDLVQILLDNRIEFRVTSIYNHNVGPLRAPRGR